jgi:hypothetical protein
MAVKKTLQGAKVIRKDLHGDSTRSVGLKGRSGELRSIYRRLENRPVLLPPVKPDTDAKVLAAAVRAVVHGKTTR